MCYNSNNRIHFYYISLLYISTYTDTYIIHIHIYVICSVCVCAQSCPTLCDPMDSNLPGSSVHGIFQARMLEWVAISCSRGSSWPRDWNCVFLCLRIDKWILYNCTPWEACIICIYTYKFFGVSTATKLISSKFLVTFLRFLDLYSCYL